MPDDDAADPTALLPPVVFLACAAGASEPAALTVVTEDGRAGLLAYSSLDRLQDLIGPEHPWVLVEAESLPDIGDTAVVFLDEPRPDGQRLGPPVERDGRPVPGPVAYLPVRHDGRTPQVRELRDGRRALLAYTALDRLASCCGPAQPWRLVRLEDLGAAVGEPFDVVIHDMHVPDRYRREGRIA